ncbi:MAG: hypothetical protein VW576_07915 [Opitutae bacterium]
MKKEAKEDLFEYRFHYHLVDSVDSSDKYFLAHDIDEAKKMFEYACNKRASSAMLDRVDKWNRWAARWEKVNYSMPNSGLN